MLVGIMISGTTSAGEKNSPPIQDLQEIKRSADELLIEENRQKRTQFTAVRINPKIIVEQCAVPLESDWTSSGSEVFRKKSSSCLQIEIARQKGWNILVPIVAPITPKNYSEILCVRNTGLPRKRRAIPRGADAAQQRCRCGARPLYKLEAAARALSLFDLGSRLRDGRA